VVYVTEGVFDRLTLARWGLPALALAGTHARREVLTLLARFPRVYLALDSDVAGREATVALRAALGLRSLPLDLSTVKDVADLGRRPDGAAIFRRAVERAEAGFASCVGYLRHPARFSSSLEVRLPGSGHGWRK
jgi:DNA primase